MATCKQYYVDGGSKTVAVFGNVSHQKIIGFASSSDADLNPIGGRHRKCADGTAPAAWLRPNGFCEWASNVSSLAKPVSSPIYQTYLTYEQIGTTIEDLPDVLKHKWLDVKKTAVATTIASAEATKADPRNQGKPFWEWKPVVVVVEVWKAEQNGSCRN